VGRLETATPGDSLAEGAGPPPDRQLASIAAATSKGITRLPGRIDGRVPGGMPRTTERRLRRGPYNRLPAEEEEGRRKRMRKVIASLFISLDGVVEAPDQWHFPYFNDEMGAAVDATMNTDTLLLGRTTYDSFAGAWPEREAVGEKDAAFAKALGDARKIVVSNQQLEFTWRNSEQLEGDLVQGVTALKNEPGGANIAMSGSISIVRQLLAAGLLDELHLLVHPIAIRKGLRLFDEGEAPIPLRLTKSETFQTGVLNLIYEPADSTGDATYEDAKTHLPQPNQ
jgi:dihydrofolate reductase